MSPRQTLFDKVWSAHEIVRQDGGESLLWVDRHFVHEGSFQGFDQVKARDGRVAEASRIVKLSFPWRSPPGGGARAVAGGGVMRHGLRLMPPPSQ